jgi:hypothetical protein
MLIEGTGKPDGCKLIRVTAEVSGGILGRVSIRGDFFASPVEGFERAEARLSGVPLTGAGAVFDAFLAEEGVEAAGIHGGGLEEVLRAAAEKTP